MLPDIVRHWIVLFSIATNCKTCFLSLVVVRLVFFFNQTRKANWNFFDSQYHTEFVSLSIFWWVRGGVSKEKENSLSLTLPYFIVFNPTMYFTLSSFWIGGGDFLCFSITTKHKGQKMLVYLQKKIFVWTTKLILLESLLHVPKHVGWP